MNSIDKQFEYWIKGSREDLRIGRILLKLKKVRHGLFFLHLSMEKLLKAMVCKATHKPAPRIHSLPVLAQRAGAILDKKQSEFLEEFDGYNIAGRYPDELIPMPRGRAAMKLTREFNDVYQCLAKQS